MTTMMVKTTSTATMACNHLSVYSLCLGGEAGDTYNYRISVAAM